MMSESAPLYLTARQIQVLQLTSEGKTAEDVSAMLHITARTVNFHLHRIMRVFDVYNKPHAVAEGFRRGILR